MMGLTFNVSIIIIPGTTIRLKISSVLSGTLASNITSLFFHQHKLSQLKWRGVMKSSSSRCSKKLTFMWNTTQNRLRLSNFSFHPFKSFLRGISRIWSFTLFPTSCWASCWCSEQQCSPSAGWPLRLTPWRLKLARGPWQRHSLSSGSNCLNHFSSDRTLLLLRSLRAFQFLFISKSPSHSLVDKHTPAEIVRLCKHTHISTLTHTYVQFQSCAILQGEGGFTS